MEIKKYVTSDCAAMADLFYHTVHEVNKKDYSKEQLDAWATGRVDLEEWDKSFLEGDTFVAYEGERLVGFGDYKVGLLDHLYVHENFQRQGVATAILREIEKIAKEQHGKEIVVHASITATPFFQSNGFSFVAGQDVEKDGIFLRNFIMEKELK